MKHPVAMPFIHSRGSSAPGAIDPGESPPPGGSRDRQTLPRHSRRISFSRTVLVWAILAGLPLAPAFGEASPPLLEEIILEGLRKTREAVVLQEIPLERGDPLTARTLTDLEEILLDTGIFSEVTLTTRPAPGEPSPATAAPSGTDPARVDLVITLREKVTLVPIPFFATDGSAATGGLILLESNLLGLNKQLITVAIAGTEGFNGILIYTDPSIAGSNWFGSLTTGMMETEEDHRLPDDTRLRDYTLREQHLSGRLGYRFTRDIRAGAGLRLTDRDISSFRGRKNTQPPEEGLFVVPSVFLDYNATRPRGVLRLGPKASLEASLVTGENHSGDIDDLGWETSAKAELALPLLPSRGGRLRLLLSGGIGDMPLGEQAEVSARDGYRTLPYQKTVADEWAGTAIFAEVPLLNRSWGAFVLSHYWEAGTFDASGHSRQYFAGPGGGFRVYLREVAIPAMGFDVAANLVDPDVVFSFTIGAQM
ncbi:Surface antigen variable number repeat-containing protein [Alkalispirochaeta americana]|uniref:Surface antigen variable number repeat-containing protein n=1 Tax=Alkalispirochaeta americana TaxID=159291 RepID=A0A1N6PR37_9SPIO|nr:POTRA domain-containing protein [Alkalispirochaeta americana]SIQ06692.1 Surface antigen variable number repeat-containing protein [Alkalispirochaeta americana]